MGLSCLEEARFPRLLREAESCLAFEEQADPQEEFDLCTFELGVEFAV